MSNKLGLKRPREANETQCDQELSYRVRIKNRATCSITTAHLSPSRNPNFHNKLPSLQHSYSSELFLVCLLLLLISLPSVCDSLHSESSTTSVLGELPVDSYPSQVSSSGPKFISDDGSSRDHPRNLVVASRWQREVFLPCKIHNLDEEQTVSWIRKRDSLVLTVDKLKLVNDPRLEIAQTSGDWTLSLSQPSDSDAGFYECQIASLEPPLSKLFELRMVEANSRISNLSTLYVRPNEQIKLVCSIETPQETDFVYWYKNRDSIKLDELRAQRKGGKQEQQQLEEWQASSISRQRSEQVVEWRASSSLTIARAQLNDTANYTCLPSNAKPSHINIIVVENGLQSQPEKRSLQAADGSYNSLRSLAGGETIRVIKLASFRLFQLVPSSWITAIYCNARKSSNVISSVDEEQSIIVQFLGLVWKQDFHRLLITLSVSLFI